MPRYCLTTTLVSHHLLTVKKSTFVHAIPFSDALFSESIVSYWSGPEEHSSIMLVQQLHDARQEMWHRIVVAENWRAVACVYLVPDRLGVCAARFDKPLGVVVQGDLRYCQYIVWKMSEAQTYINPIAATMLASLNQCVENTGRPSDASTTRHLSISLLCCDLPKVPNSPVVRVGENWRYRFVVSHSPSILQWHAAVLGRFC